MFGVCQQSIIVNLNFDQQLIPLLHYTLLFLTSILPSSLLQTSFQPFIFFQSPAPLGEAKGNKDGNANDQNNLQTHT